MEKNTNDDGSWMVVSRRKRAIEQRPEQMIVTVEDALVNTLVVWTQQSVEQLKNDMMRKHPAAAKLVEKARAKQGHIILMARSDEDSLLRSMLGALQNIGFQVREYMVKQPSLPSRAQKGMEQQIRGAGVCHFFLQGKQCAWGNRCRFRCYKDGGTWSI